MVDIHRLPHVCIELLTTLRRLTRGRYYSPLAFEGHPVIAGFILHSDDKLWMIVIINPSHQTERYSTAEKQSSRRFDDDAGGVRPK